MKNKRSAGILCTAGACLALLLHGAASFADAADGDVRQPSRQEAWGYQPWWMQPNWPLIDLGLWQRVIFFELNIRADGTVGNIDALPPEWHRLNRATSHCGSALDIAFTLFDEKDFEQLFSAAASRDRLRRQILVFADTAKADGIHLDFEIYRPVSAASVEGFRDFLEQLSNALRQKEPARVLSAFGVIGAAQDLFDKKALTQVDFIIVQGYDAHWVESTFAGPVSPAKGSHRLSWENALRHYLDLGAERSRLLFSIPYFGYEWPVASQVPGSATTGRGKEMTYAPIPSEWVPAIKLSALEQSKRHGILRDPVTGSPYYVYRDKQGNWFQGWFEDKQSLADKIAFVKRERLAGIAAFPLGYDAGKFDSLLTDAFGKRPKCLASEIAPVTQDRIFQK